MATGSPPSRPAVRQPITPPPKGDSPPSASPPTKAPPPSDDLRKRGGEDQGRAAGSAKVSELSKVSEVSKGEVKPGEPPPAPLGVDGKPLEGGVSPLPSKPSPPCFRTKWVSTPIILTLMKSHLTAHSIVQFSMTCKWVYRDVEREFRQMVLNLPLKNAVGITTNITYWLRMMRFFFCDSATLQPISRLTYKPTVNALKEAHRTFAVQPHTQSESQLSVTLDRIPPESIQYCARWHPQAHTSHVSRQLPAEGAKKQGVTQVLQIPQFLTEYLKRVRVNSEELVWLTETQLVSPIFVTKLFLTFLKGLKAAVDNCKGKLEFRRSEYLVNLCHHITHRIWLQVTVLWGPESSVGPFGLQQQQHNINKSPAEIPIGIPGGITMATKGKGQTDGTGRTGTGTPSKAVGTAGKAVSPPLGGPTPTRPVAPASSPSASASGSGSKPAATPLGSKRSATPLGSKVGASKPGGSTGKGGHDEAHGHHHQHQVSPDAFGLYMTIADHFYWDA